MSLPGDPFWYCPALCCHCPATYLSLPGHLFVIARLVRAIQSCERALILYIVNFILDPPNKSGDDSDKEAESG